MSRSEKGQPQQVRAALHRSFAATLGTLPLAAAASSTLAVLFTSSIAGRVAVALLLLLPLWTLAMCVAFLGRRGGQVWLSCAIGTALFGV